MTTVTTALAIDALWIKTSGTGTNLFGTTTTGSLTIFSTDVFVSGSAYYLAISDTAPVGWNVTSKAADDISVTFKWQYLNSSSTWTDLTTFRDETGGFDSAVTNAEIRWAIPTDWVSMSLTLTSNTTGTVLIRTGYLHRMLPVDSNTSVVQTVGNAIVYFVKLGSANSSGIYIEINSFLGCFCIILSVSSVSITFAGIWNGLLLCGCFVFFRVFLLHKLTIL